MHQIAEPPESLQRWMEGRGVVRVPGIPGGKEGRKWSGVKEVTDD